MKTESLRRIFSLEELKKFDQDLQKYRKEAILKDGTKVYPINFTELHKDKKTIDKDGAVIIEIDEFGDYITPTRYERLENKIEQYNQWKFRDEFIDRKKIEEYEDMAGGVFTIN